MNIFKKTIIGAILGLFLSFSALTLNVKAQETKQKEEIEETNPLGLPGYEDYNKPYNYTKSYSDGTTILDISSIPTGSIITFNESLNYNSWPSSSYRYRLTNATNGTSPNIINMTIEGASGIGANGNNNFYYIDFAYYTTGQYTGINITGRRTNYNYNQSVRIYNTTNHNFVWYLKDRQMTTLRGLYLYVSEDSGSTWTLDNTNIDFLAFLNNNATIQKPVITNTLTLNGNGSQFLITSSQTYETSISGSATEGNYYNDMQTILNRATITRTGYTLIGWNTNANAPSGLTQQQINNLTGDQTLFAIWEENIVYYTIYFNANGADSGSVPQAVSIQNGSTYTLPGNTGNLAKTGYTFQGWGAGPLDTIPITSEVITSGRTYYAIWQALPTTTYTISFNANGADSGSVPNSITEPDGTTITLPGNTGLLAKAGYTFIGWNTAPDATAARENYTLNGSNVVMYAVWSQTSIIYSVVFDPLNADSGSVPSSLSVEAGTTITLPGNTGNLVRDGYTWVGWNTDPLAEVALNTIQVNNNLTLYPIWSQDPVIHYTFSILLNDELLAAFTTTNISEHYMFTFAGFDSQLFSIKLNGLRNLSAIRSDPAYILSYVPSDIQFSFAGEYINTILIYIDNELVYDWTEQDIRENGSQWIHLWGGGNVVINIVSDDNLTSPINSFRTITRTTFGAMQELFDLQFGWISIGGIIAIVLSISVMFFIFKIIRGGGNS